MPQGPSGFAPPCAVPNKNATVAPLPLTDHIALPVHAGEDAKTFETDPAIANKYIQPLAQGSLPPPATVFCSRELENGLADYITAETAPLSGPGRFPSDDALRAKARDILGTTATAADDAVLLEKFKGTMREKLGQGAGLGGQTPAPASTGRSQSEQLLPALSAGDLGTMAMPLDLDMDLTDGQLTDILQGMDFQFGDVAGLDDPVLGPGFGL